MKANNKVKMLFGGVVCALTLAAASLVVAPVHAQAATKTAICPQNNALTLADRSKIQLDPYDEWVDGTNFYNCSFRLGGYYISCNNACGKNNTLRNHFGLDFTPQHDEYAPGNGHAWAFTCLWHADKQAYTIQAAMPWIRYQDYSAHFSDCNFKYWNLSGKNTKNHTRIQTWTNGAKKAENLFWFSKNIWDYDYRIWSAYSGRPVGYIKSDFKNLRTLDSNEADTEQRFCIEPIDSNRIEENWHDYTLPSR